MKTVALYGGSFDPPHIGHEAVVKALADLSFIDEVVVMPTYLNPFKSEFTAPATLRLKWLNEIFSEYEKVRVSDFEVSLEKKVPTLHTVKHLLKSNAKVYVVIGADNLASLHSWYGYDELQNLASFIIASRDNIETPKRYIKINVEVDVSSSALRKHIDKTKLPQKNGEAIEKFYKEHNAK